MKNTLLLLFAFIMIGGGTFWLLQESKEDKKTSLLGADRKFAIEDMDQVHKIFLADHEGHQTTLVRNGNDWKVNGKYKARANAMENLLKAVKNVEVKYQPGRLAVPNIIKTLSSQGIKVEIYNKNGDLIKSYYVGGASTDERGTFMIMAGAEQPYVTYMPNWSGNIRYRYNLVDDDWRDRTAFSTEFNEVKNLIIEYPKQKNKSYQIKNVDGQFSIDPFYDITPKQNGTVAQGKFQQYLNGFEKLNVIGFKNLYAKRDSIMGAIPFCKISLTQMNDEITTIVLYPIFPKPQYDEKSNQVIPTEGKASRYFAWLNEKDFVTVDQKFYKKVLWSYASFYE